MWFNKFAGLNILPWKYQTTVHFNPFSPCTVTFFREAAYAASRLSRNKASRFLWRRRLSTCICVRGVQFEYNFDNFETNSYTNL